jgi:hypothetical protein
MLYARALTTSLSETERLLENCCRNHPSTERDLPLERRAPFWIEEQGERRATR